MFASRFITGINAKHLAVVSNLLLSQISFFEIDGKSIYFFSIRNLSCFAVTGKGLLFLDLVSTVRVADDDPGEELDRLMKPSTWCCGRSQLVWIGGPLTRQRSRERNTHCRQNSHAPWSTRFQHREDSACLRRSAWLRSTERKQTALG